jgi:hypothetical protein
MITTLPDAPKVEIEELPPEQETTRSSIETFLKEVNPTKIVTRQHDYEIKDQVRFAQYIRHMSQRYIEEEWDYVKKR